MLEQRAQVIDVRPGQVELAVNLESACGSCHSADTCSSGTVAKAFVNKRQRLLLNTSLVLGKGQWVRLGVEQQGVTALAAITYLLPLLGLILAGLVGQLWWVDGLGWPEPAALGLALVGGYAGFVLARRLATRLGARMQQPVILGLAPAMDAGTGH